jgi:hypothetical protein
LKSYQLENIKKGFIEASELRNFYSGISHMSKNVEAIQFMNEFT